ncbi:hypothetical protein ML080_002725 [Klebsiella variicola]|nr:hypothetical protein [Klebsiella variicola]
MTDITELAQREKFEAWAEEVGALPWGILKKHRNQDGSYPGPHYTYMWKAWLAASAELVEALEKAQQVNEELCKLLPPGAEYMDQPDGGDVTPLEGVRRMVADYRQRIAELEEAEQKLCAANVTLDARAELAERQLAELESRTVKLPEPFELAKVSGGLSYYYADEVDAALIVAGIKVEAE